MHNIYVTRDTNFLPVAIIDSSRQGEDLQNYEKVQPEQNYIKFVNYNAASPTRVTAQVSSHLSLPARGHQYIYHQLSELRLFTRGHDSTVVAEISISRV